MVQNKELNFIGLASKAGKIISGYETVIKAIQRNEVFYVIITEDASENTKKRFVDKCTYYNVPYKISYNSEQLGHSIGKLSRMIVAITDKGFADKLGIMK